MISGSKWLENYARWHKGTGIIEAEIIKLGSSDLFSDQFSWGLYKMDPQLKRKIAELDPAINLALTKGQRLLADPAWAVSPSDPDYRKVEHFKWELRPRYDQLVSIGNTTGAFARELKIEDSHWTKTLAKYFLDRIQKVGEALEKGSDDFLAQLLKYLPFVIAGGLALILLNVASLVPKK